MEGLSRKIIGKTTILDSEGDNIVVNVQLSGCGVIVATAGTKPGTPFAVSSAQAYRVGPPPELSSDEYATAVDEVMQLGAVDSTERTADQTEIALFWE